MKAKMVRTGLRQVRAELDAWRGRRRKGDRIPEGLWRQAVRAAGRHGLNPVSQALRLDYYQLKRRVEGGSCAEGVEAGGGPVFVELSGGPGGEEPKADGRLACLVEMEKANGTRMRICVREAAAVDWGKLKEAFLGA